MTDAGRGSRVTETGRQDPRRSVVSWLSSGHIEAEIKRALPDHIPLPWFLRCAQTALLNNPSLATADKASLLRELVSVAQLGLVIDPQLGEAWLIIDRHGKVQRRVGYQGLRRLAMQSGEVTSLNAQAVYKNDICAITLGDTPSVKHEVAIQVSDRGPIIGYYAVARVKGISEPIAEWMSQAQVDAHRDRYSDAYKGGKSGPWADPLASVEMGRKTVFRRLAKWLPKSPLLAEALSDEDRADMRDVTPSLEHEMLPAPSDDPMDDVVAAQSRSEPRQRATSSPRTDEARDETTAVAERAGPPNERTSAQPEAPKRRGRPPKQRDPEPETEVDTRTYAEEYANRVMGEIHMADPEQVNDILERERRGIGDLPDDLRTQVVASAQERQAEDEPPLADENGNGKSAKQRAQEIAAALRDAPTADALRKLYSRIAGDVTKLPEPAQLKIAEIYDEVLNTFAQPGLPMGDGE